MLHFLYMWQSYLRSGRWWLSVPYAAAAANCWNWVTCFFRNLSSVCMQLPLTAVHNSERLLPRAEYMIEAGIQYFTQWGIRHTPHSKWCLFPPDWSSIATSFSRSPHWRITTIYICLAGIHNQFFHILVRNGKVPWHSLPVHCIFYQLPHRRMWITSHAALKCFQLSKSCSIKQGDVESFE